MKILGMIGGLGPESTIEYYQRIIELYRARRRDGSYPQFYPRCPLFSLVKQG